jgi:hypothetical protein
VREEVAVGDPERERIGGPVGVAPHGDALGVNPIVGEGVLQSSVDAEKVRAVAAADE